ncbi:hypothetical protein B0T14DRAFT_441322 [Immersiella caudata]|uniref:Uncharacterized protein n=1 Tax=Immersiella caudata TaxID=314043 RepID=A0AA39WC22_9PEZI|nr:hypothetical protein B0T14DRAFT_441322 [Immersiella caudata]
MGQQISRTVFDGLLAKTHVQHALIQPNGRHNDLPTIRFLGDVRFQRAYMSYFSMELTRFSGSPKALAFSHLLAGDKPLISGLFAGLGRPLVFLGDAMELHSPILLVQSLALCAVDWMDPIHDILTHLGQGAQASGFLSPEQILNRVAYDGRLSGIMKSGPGFQGISQVFASPGAKAAVLDYVRQLDCRDAEAIVDQLCALSPIVLCGSHRPGYPAFDFYLSWVPSWVNSLRVLLPSLDDDADKITLLRGVWLLIILAYVTQLRPVLDASLIFSDEALGDCTWEKVLAEFREQGISGGKYKDLQLLRTLRSLWSLGRGHDGDRQLNLRAACKIVREWKGWTGLGADREETLNIRL